MKRLAELQIQESDESAETKSESRGGGRHEREASLSEPVSTQTPLSRYWTMPLSEVRLYGVTPLVAAFCLPSLTERLCGSWVMLSV